MAVEQPPITFEPHAGRRYFTVAEADRALVYVSRVVADVCRTYRTAVSIQHRLEFPLPDDDVEKLREQYEDVVSELNGFTDELRAVGVELKDCEKGLIDFPAMVDGREVCLCWKRGEEKIVAWHEIDTGYAGRRSIDELTDDRCLEH